MTEQLMALMCVFVVGCASVLPPMSWTYKNAQVTNTVQNQCTTMCANAVQGNCLNDCEGFAYYSSQIAVDLNQAK